MRFTITPYNLLLVSALSMVVAAFVFSNRGFDIHLHDTYIITTFDFVFGLLAAFQILVWAIYLISKNILLHPTLSWIHSIITIVCICILVAGFFYTTNKNSYNLSNRKYSSIENIIKHALLSVLVVQSVFLINVLGGLFKKLLQREKNN